MCNNKQVISVRVKSTESQGICVSTLSTMVIGMVIHGRKIIYNNNQVSEISCSEIFVLGCGVHYEENVPENGIYEQVAFYLTAADIQNAIISLSSTYDIKVQSPKCCDKCRFGNFVSATANVMISDFFHAVNQSFSREAFRNTHIAQRIKIAELMYLILTFGDECIKYKVISGSDISNSQFATKVYESILSGASVVELAEQTNRSLTAFKKEFQRQFNTPPHKWMVTQRLQRAKVMLTSSHMTISEIGANCGFNNISHFIKLFKQQYHNTPSALRKSLQQNNR